jgi:hypothetical protein
VHAINGNLQLVGGLSIRLNPVQGVNSIESSPNTRANLKLVIFNLKGSEQTRLLEHPQIFFLKSPKDG